MNSPHLVCPELPPFDATDLDAVMQAFQCAPGCVLGQSWLAVPETEFAPASVWAGWRENALFVFGKLTDTNIFTFATQPNERLWELGDVLEIFLRPASQTAYSEFQVAPNNLQLQLRYANAAALARARKANSIGEALVHPISFHSRVWARPERSCWHVLTEIPAAVAVDAPTALPDQTWHFSFCRYDYTRGSSHPIISSTSALTQPDFHRLAEWGTLKFEP
jgi:hypothetical protein